MNPNLLMSHLIGSRAMKALILVFCLGFVLPLAGCESRESKERVKALSVLNPQRDFTLIDQDGNEFHLKDHRGKVVLLFFGFLSCPDICPVTLSKLSRTYGLLGSKSRDVLTVFVSVDPDRDTPQKLKEYLKYFKIRAVGLTGTKAQIDSVVDAFKGYYHITETESAAGYLVDHSSYVYVIDGQGKVNGLMHFEETAENIADFIKKLI